MPVHEVRNKMTGYVTLHDAYFVFSFMIIMILVMLNFVGYVYLKVKSLNKRIEKLESQSRQNAVTELEEK